MSYSESVVTTVNLGPSPNVAPQGVVEHALSLRDGSEMLEASSAASHSLGLDQLSEQNQTLFQTRVFGGLATKLALSSYFSENLSLYALSRDDQLEELENLANNYAAANDNGDLYTLLASPSRHNPLSHVPNGLVRSWVYDARRKQMSLTDHLKALKSYIDVTPGTFPPDPYYIDSIGANDVTLVQAFGRDTVTDEELVAIRDVRKELGDNGTMMAFLDDITFEPGASNIALADEVARQLQSSAPVEQILQWEVTYALYQKYPKVYESYRNYVHTVWPHTDSYRTFEVKQDSVEIMDELGLYNAAELAHPGMMARAVGILEKLGVQPDPIAADIPYDPESTQPYVRNSKIFTGREVLARIEHVLRGRVKF